MIKTKLIETEKGRILLVDGLPEDVDKIEIPRKGVLYFYQGVILNSIEIPSGNWQLLGKLSEVTEEQAERVVEVRPETAVVAKCYRDYMDREYWRSWIDTALESLHSLVEANVKLRNEYGDGEPELEATCCNVPVSDRNGYPQCCGIPVPTEESIYKQDEWRSEEAKVFKNPVLFFEPK